MGGTRVFKNAAFDHFLDVTHLRHRQLMPYAVSSSYSQFPPNSIHCHPHLLNDGTNTYIFR